MATKDDHRRVLATCPDCREKVYDPRYDRDTDQPATRCDCGRLFLHWDSRAYAVYFTAHNTAPEKIL